MKLLILTQKVDINDPILGFFHGWISEFSKHCEKITVIALGVGEYDLPHNVKILSLGKEKDNFQFSIFNFQSISNSKIFKRNYGKNSLNTEKTQKTGGASPRPSLRDFKTPSLRAEHSGARQSGVLNSWQSKLKYIFNFYKYIWRERKNYDNVFVHMNPEYVVLGGLFWRIMGKKIALWYAHKSVNLKLRVAEKLSSFVVTSTQSGFRLKSKKKKIIGQGIDTNLFKKSFFEPNSIFTILSVGRIAISKDYKTLILASEILKNKGLNFKVKILGGPLTKEDEIYFNEMVLLLKNKGLEENIDFVGSVANKNIPEYLNQADIFVNMGKTGSLDKVIVEGMSFGLPVLTCNEAVLEVFGQDYQQDLMYNKDNSKDLAEKIENLMKKEPKEREKIGQNLRKIVEKDHSLSKLITKILSFY